MKFQPLLLMLVAMVAVAGPMAGAVERPNIVFVLFDDFGWGQPPSNRGDSPFKTPSFDGLAREGMRFTDFYAGSTVCGPWSYRNRYAF